MGKIPVNRIANLKNKACLARAAVFQSYMQIVFLLLKCYYCTSQMLVPLPGLDSNSGTKSSEEGGTKSPSKQGQRLFSNPFTSDLKY